MTGRNSPRAQRLARHLIRLACLRLSGETREDRYREWTAELHAILYDPGTRSPARRTVRALLYAADQNRGVRRLARTARDPVARPARWARKLLLAETPSGHRLAAALLMLTWVPAVWVFSPHGAASVTAAVAYVVAWAVGVFRPRTGLGGSAVQLLGAPPSGLADDADDEHGQAAEEGQDHQRHPRHDDGDD